LSTLEVKKIGLVRVFRAGNMRIYIVYATRIFFSFTFFTLVLFTFLFWIQKEDIKQRAHIALKGASVAFSLASVASTGVYLG